MSYLEFIYEYWSLPHTTEHYNQSAISVNYLADRFNLSPNYLSKLFKEHTFSNFVDHLIEVRMKAASRLLLETYIESYYITYK